MGNLNTTAPCPKCKKDDTREKFGRSERGNIFIDYWIQCLKCKHTGPRRQRAIDAIKAWNEEAGHENDKR